MSTGPNGPTRALDPAHRMTQEAADALREPFPEHAIGKLPKGGVKLDYVGHAATTDRLLQVDPYWSWEPLALDERGLPSLDADGNLWIKLTVCGVTRLGVGDGPTAKERIGDAIRNAAMRFGVALDLWAKEDLRGDGGLDRGGEELDAQLRDFNPARKLLPGAIDVKTEQDANSLAQESEVLRIAAGLKSDLPVLAASAVIEGKVAEEWKGPEWGRHWKRVANFVVAAGAGNGFPPPGHEEIAAAFAWAFDGYALPAASEGADDGSQADAPATQEEAAEGRAEGDSAPSG